MFRFWGVGFRVNKAQGPRLLGLGLRVLGVGALGFKV